jgi:hypothetical protein
VTPCHSPPLSQQKPLTGDKAARQHGLAHGVADHAGGQVFVGVHFGGVKDRELIFTGWRANIALALPFGFPAAGICCGLRITLSGAFHEPIQRLWAIWWIGMIVPGLRRDLDDPILSQPEVIDPAENVQPRRLALPPGREAGIGGKAQRAEQFCEEPIKIRISRSRVLLLLYRFT